MVRRKQKMQTSSIVKFIVLVAFLFVALYLGKYSGFAQYFTRDMLHSFGMWTPLIFIIVYAIGSTLFIPGTLLTLLGALLFGTWLGTFYNVLGATLGAVLAFIIARFGGRNFILGLLKGKLLTLDDRIGKNALGVTFVLRLVPLFPFNLLNFALGLTKIKMKDYVLGTVLGIIPGTFVYTYLFATLGERVITEGFSWGALFTLDVLFPVLLFVLLIIFSLFFRKKATTLYQSLKR